MIAPATATKPEPQTTEATGSREANVPCDHCGLPAPPSSEGPSFCCDGCRGAYALIHEWDLEDYYALRDQLGGKASRPSRKDDELALLDQPSYLGDALRYLDDEHCSVRLAVDGVHCGACAWLIERSVPLVNGWQSASVNLPKREVEITFAPSSTRLSAIARTLATFGYQLRPLPDNSDEVVDPERLQRLRRLAVAAFCFMNAMWIAIALYAGRDGSIDPRHAHYLTLFGTALALVSVFGPGSVFLRSAWAALRTRTPHIDLPVSLGLVAGSIGSLVSVGLGVGETYFDSLCGLVFFLLLGRELQARGHQRASAAVRALASLRPPLAHRVAPDGSTELIRARDVAVGDVVEVPAGDLVPVDGVVVEGRSHVDQSILTGESAPVPVSVDSAVSAGVRNIERSLRVQAQATAGETRVAAISRLVEESLSSKTPLIQRADRLGGLFVIVVLIASVVCFVSALATTGALEAGQRAVALLVVACPCALALATPLAIGVAVGRAAKRGILVRRGDAFEQLHRTGTIWFDKTGTLTAGRPSLVAWNGCDESLAFAAAVERESRHPVATCLVEAADARELPTRSATDVEHFQRGIVGEVDGRVVAVGSHAFLGDRRITIPSQRRVQAAAFAASGAAPNFVAIDGDVVAVFAVADPLRPDAKQTVQRYREAGWNVGLLSGDHRDVVASIAAQLQIPRQQAHGELSPEEKLEFVVSASDTDQPVVFVGDGVNDAAALAAADVGIATTGAAEASLQAASIYCPGDLTELAALLRASDATVRAIRRLLTVSLAYNVLAGAAAVAGYVTPLVAAILMPISSLTVTALAFATTTFDRETGS